MPDGRTIFSAIQMKSFGCKIVSGPKELNGGEQPYIESPDGYQFPLAVRDGLEYMDVRPVLDSEWGVLPETYMTSPNEWNPSGHDHEVDPSWYKTGIDKVKEKFKETGHDELGNIKSLGETGLSIEELSDEEEDDVREPVSVSAIQIHLTKIVEDELEEEVIQYFVGDQVFTRFMDEEDKTCDWGDRWEQNRARWQSYDVLGRRRSSRRKKAVDYSDTKRKVPEKKHIPGTTKRTGETISKPPAKDEPASKLEPIPEDDVVRRDYNNPAKHMDQNEPGDTRIITGPLAAKKGKIDYPRLARFFGGASEKTILKTLENTTQLGRLGAVEGLRLYQRLKAPNPALNVGRRNEPVATDTIFGPGAPAIDNGSTAAQFFVGRKSGFCEAEGIGESDKKFPVALLNHIRKYGAMDQLISDNAKAELSARVVEILNTYGIPHFMSEPHNKNQNFAERVWQQVKDMVEKILNMSNAPPECWLLALEYACFIMNHTAFERLNWRTPTEWLLGYTPDITVLLIFYFWEPVYYKQLDAKFPTDSREALGRFVGIAENVGNAITFKILTESKKVIHRSVVRSAARPGVFQNLRANEKAPKLAPKDPNCEIKIGNESIPVTVETVTEEDQPSDAAKPNEEEGETPIEMFPGGEQTAGESRTFIRSAMEDAVKEGGNLPTIDVESIQGRTFITTPDAEGEQKRAQIESVEPTEEFASDGKERLFRFRCKVGEERFEEILTYNRMLDWCDHDKDKDDFYRILSISGHRRKSKEWEVLVNWASGQSTWHGMNQIFQDDPVTVSMYAKKHGLLDTEGWKRCKRYCKNSKTLGRMLNQVRLKNFRNRPVYKYGLQVPRSHEEAMMIDEKNGDHRWAESEAKELSQLMEYDSFESLGVGAPIPEGYKKIPCHFVYDIKHDGRFKSRFVAGGHKTGSPTESVYSGVVSLQGVRLVTFLAELNDMELWGTDVGNAYLESYTKEKVAFIAGPEFGEYAGHTMVVIKAQYGLKSSGKCWHDKLYDVLRSMDFFPSKAEPDIWMRDKGDHYEYIAVYVDDLLIASRNPQEIIDGLEGDPGKFKLKGTGPVKFHLGCDYWRDEDGTLCVGPQKYIERMEDAYKQMFGSAPKQNVQSPMERNDHPELDESELLDADGISKYQSLIGTLQWTISLGRFDIATAVMTLSGFRVAPRVGHLERAKRICGYLVKFKQGCIRIRTEIPDYSDLPTKEYDWSRSVYGNVKEQRPTDAPPPKGKLVVTTSYKDANLMHDMATGKAVTGILHFVNQTPVDWFSKKQPTVETATYGSELAAARAAVQQIAALRITLQYLGVPIGETSYLFGDNESVVKSSTIPHSLLNKRHHALAYHFTREAIASGMVQFHHIPGDCNAADILSKHWGHSQIYPTLKPIMFYVGDTMDLIEIEESMQ